MNMQKMDEIAEHLGKYIATIGTRNFCIILALLFAAFFYVASRISGWSEMAKHYPSRNKYQGEWIMQPEDDDPERGGLIVYFNNGESENAIKLGADSQGLYIEMSLLFRLFHPPLFVPWREITSEGLKMLPWSKKKHHVRFTFAMAPKVPLEVDSYVAQEIEKRARGSWTMPELD